MLVQFVPKIIAVPIAVFQACNLTGWGKAQLTLPWPEAITSVVGVITQAHIVYLHHSAAVTQALRIHHHVFVEHFILVM